MTHLRIRGRHTAISMFCLGLLAVSPAWAQLGTTDIIAQEGDAAADSNGTIGSFATNLALNDAGQVAYIVNFYNATVGGFTDDSSINLFSGGVHQIISRKGDAAPDANGVQSNFSSADLEGLGSGGAVLFSNSLTGTSGGFADDAGVFRAQPPGSRRSHGNSAPPPSRPAIGTTSTPPCPPAGPTSTASRAI